VNGIERELREALGARASAVTVGRADEPGLGRRLVTARRRRRARLGGGALAILVALGALSVMAQTDDRGPSVVAGPDLSSTTSLTELSTTAASAPPTPATTVPAAGPTSTTPPASAATTTTVARTTSTTTTTTPPLAPPLAPLPAEAVWPPAGSATAFSTPTQAATDFALRFLGMGTPQLGTPRVAGADATVDLRPLSTASLTSVVSLRRIDGRGWVVLGCAAPSIQVDQPAVGATISSPLNVRGRAQAFEGTVDVEVRRDGATVPLGRSFGTGGGTEILPFEATVTFTRPSEGRGTVVVSEGRADDGSQGPAAATVLRVAF